MALKSYEELIKVDVRQYCEERDGFTYLNWAKCIELLRQNGATEVYWEPILIRRPEAVLEKQTSSSRTRITIRIVVMKHGSRSLSMIRNMRCRLQ